MWYYPSQSVGHVVRLGGDPFSLPQNQVVSNVADRAELIRRLDKAEMQVCLSMAVVVRIIMVV